MGVDVPAKPDVEGEPLIPAAEPWPLPLPLALTWAGYEDMPSEAEGE